MRKPAIGIDDLRLVYKRKFPLYEFMKLEILEAGPLQAKCCIPISKNNLNHFGTVHAAIQWALAETLGGTIFWANFDMDAYLAVVTEVKMAFIKPAVTAVTSDTTIRQEELDRMQRELEVGGMTNYSLEINVCDTSSQVVAHASAQYHARKPELFRNLPEL